MFMLRLQRRL